MRHIIAVALLSLAACSGGEEAGNNSSDSSGQVLEQTPTNLQDDPNNTVVPLEAPAPSPIATAFPSGFQGRWALGDADCDPANADVAKGLMVVAADRVTHYESRGRPTRIEATGADRIVADLSFAGEGQAWTRRTAFALLDGGRTLTAETPDDPETPMRNLRYIRCPTGATT